MHIPKINLDTKTILIGSVILLLFAFCVCMLTGDVYLSKIAFDSKQMVCDNTSTAVTDLSSSGILDNLCISLNDAEIGFIRFRIVMFWILGISANKLGVICYYKIYLNDP